MRNTNRNVLADAFESLFPVIRELEAEGYCVFTSHDHYSGYGFQANLDKKHYINVSIFYVMSGIEYFVSLVRRNSNYAHDIVNDIPLNKGKRTSPEEATEYVHTLLQYWKDNIKCISPRDRIKRKLDEGSSLSTQDKDTFMQALDTLHSFMKDNLNKEVIMEVVDYLKSSK